MLIAYLRNQDPAHVQWMDDIPGVHICRFALSDLPEKSILPPPNQEPSPAFEILFCLDGQAVVEWQDAQSHQIKRRQILIFTNTAQLHLVKISPDLQGILIAIDGGQPAETGVLSACACLGLPLDLRQLQANMEGQHRYAALWDNSWTQAVFDLLAFLPEADRGSYCLLKAMELLYLLGEKDYGMAHLARTEEQVVQYVVAARAYMEAHLSDKITISHLCRVLSVSPTYLKTGFRRVYGMTIHRCLMDLRMQRAGALLRSTGQPVCRIAQLVGYEGMSQFNTAFRQYYGVTPGAFKKMSKTTMDCPFR